MAENLAGDPRELPMPLGLALAQLPLEAPDRDAWPVLAGRLRARRGVPRDSWVLEKLVVRPIRPAISSCV